MRIITSVRLVVHMGGLCHLGVITTASPYGN